MTAGRTITVSLLGMFLLTSLFGARRQERGTASPGRAAAERESAPQANGEKKAAAQNNQPGVQALQRLARMTPEERQRALASLPPQRRREILEKFREFQNLPPTARQRVTPELERLQSLPPQRQNQVRRSLQQFRALPDDRKATIRQELGRLSAMPDEDRRARMNSEEFRNRYSPAEQQMIGNLSEVVAPND
jgi:phage-related protein